MTRPIPGRGIALSDAQRVDWLRLIRSDNVGPVAFQQLINRYGSAGAALDALPELVRRGGARRAFRIADRAAVESEIATAERMGARFVGLGEPDYPEALRAGDTPPPLLAIRGRASTAAGPCVGIVGSRNASLAGTKLAGQLAAAIGRSGYAVVSGLARGIDAAAHRASLGTGTVACMAGGLDKPFPPENVPLMEEIMERGGAVISEMPFGWQPRARDFPRRNRLIAGLSLGVLAVEAARRSGSLITARLANEMGRLVFATPGSPLDPRSAGTNALIKSGATMVTEPADVIDALEPLRGGVPNAAQGRLLEADPVAADADEAIATTERERIVEALGPTPVEVDELIVHVGAQPATVHMVLLELELAGRLERHAGGLVSLVLADA